MNYYCLDQLPSEAFRRLEPIGNHWKQRQISTVVNKHWQMAGCPSGIQEESSAYEIALN
jgi:hypothetical protein